MPRLNAIGIVSADMAESVRFYRLLGLEVPDPDGHLDVELGNGVRLMIDTEDVIRRYAQVTDPDGVPVDLCAWS